MKKKIFTLIELIVVIAIVIVLAAAAFLVLSNFVVKARDTRRASDVANIEKSLMIYLNNPKVKLLPTGTNAIGFTGVYYSGTTATTAGSGIVVYQGPFNDGYFALLKAQGFQELMNVSKDPMTMNYIIAVDRQEQKYFNIATVKEAGGTDGSTKENLIKGNFNKNNTLKLAWTNAKTLTGLNSLLAKGIYTGTSYAKYILNGSGKVTSKIRTGSSFILDASTSTTSVYTYDPTK